MLNCPKCGEEVSPEMKFCPRCGASLAAARPSTFQVREKVPKGPDVLGLASAGVILIILALTYLRNPIVPSVIIDYLESMGNQGAFIKPPSILLNAAIFFLYAVGLWGIVQAGLRLVFQRSVGKALGDLVGAFFSFFLAFLLARYDVNVFTGRMTLAFFIIGLGLLVIANAIVHFAFPER